MAQRIARHTIRDMSPFTGPCSAPRSTPPETRGAPEAVGSPETHTSCPICGTARPSRTRFCATCYSEQAPVQTGPPRSPSGQGRNVPAKPLSRQWGYWVALSVGCAASFGATYRAASQALYPQTDAAILGALLDASLAFGIVFAAVWGVCWGIQRLATFPMQSVPSYHHNYSGQVPPTAQELERLAQLRRELVLTDSEFAAAKKRVLGGDSGR